MKYIFLFFTVILAQSLFSQNIERIDFEAGGFVLAQLPTSDGNHVYARTDVGGAYKKYRDEEWKFISHFAVTPAALKVQAIDINPNNNNEIIIAVGMDYQFDDHGRGLWKSDNGGDSWYQILGEETGHSDINYGGNLFRVKIGGPCARWHPSVNNRIITGGLASSNGRPPVYLSNDNGRTWENIGNNSSITGNTVCIQIHPAFPDEIWVGTDQGLWITRDNGNTWSEKIFPSEINGVYQMLLKQDGRGGLTGFVTTGRLFRIENNAARITDLTGKFGLSTGYGSEMIGLQFLNSAESILECSTMGYPARISTNDGETWEQHLEYILDKRYNPKHSLITEDKVYNSHIILFQSPADFNTWYASGGEGPFITTDKGKTWRYNGSGIDMTVVYDVTFSKTGDIYIPISDWGMAKTDDSHRPKIKLYSRNFTKDPPPPEKNSDSYLPNVCRVLVSDVQPNRIYLIGGSVFTYYPAIAKSENRGEPYSYRIMTPKGLPAYPDFGPGKDAVITEGAITTDGVSDHLVLMVGGGQYNHKIFNPSNPSADWYGVYYSSNNGASFEKSVLEGKSEEIYRNSIVSGIFITSDFLDVDPSDPSRLYLYMEGGNESGVYAGGLFVSNDYGKSFSFLNYVVENPAIDYRNKGAIDIDPSGSGTLWAGIRNYGLFKSQDRGETFSKMTGWKSVFTVDSKEKNIAVFGMREDDTHNKIYLSRDWGETWEHIYINGYGVIPSVRKLDLRENKDGELWISTGGQGVFVYYY